MDNYREYDSRTHMDETIPTVGGGSIAQAEYRRVMIEHGNHMPTVVAHLVALTAEVATLKRANAAVRQLAMFIITDLEGKRDTYYVAKYDTAQAFLKTLDAALTA